VSPVVSHPENVIALPPDPLGSEIEAPGEVDSGWEEEAIGSLVVEELEDSERSTSGALFDG